MLRVLELFAGIGACSKALTNLGIEHEIVDAVEIDKYAVKSFNAIHGTNFEPQDITKWDKDIECDLIMHGSPCQDFSVAGKNAGGDKDSGTRSSLMYETLRIVEKLKPKYVIWENVKNLLSAKHRHNFDAYLEAMERLGYHSQYQVLNAKDYGIPQNRERVFTVSIRNDLDVDFKFPEPQKLTIRLKDVLEPQVDEKYYLSDEQTKRLKMNKNIDVAKTVRTGGRGSVDRHSWDIVAEPKVVAGIGDKKSNGGTQWYQQDRVYDDGVAISVTSAFNPYYRTGGEPKCVRVGGLYDSVKSKHQAGSVYDSQGIAATLSTMQGGNQEPIIVASRGRGEHNMQHLEPRKDNLTNTITSVQKDNYVANSLRIRKLTPRECWRLMGFDDADFDKAQAAGISNTQLYKQAGNSIVVNCLEAIFNGIEWSDNG